MAKKLLAGLMATAMVGCALSGTVMAEEAELLPGGGSNIIYCITPLHFQCLFQNRAGYRYCKGRGAGLRSEVLLP